VAAAAGTILVQVSLSAPRYPWDETLMNLAGRGGGLMLGIGAALVATRPIHRVIIAAPLGVFAAAIVSGAATGMLAVIYVAAVTLWWAQCIWRLVRSPAGYPPVALATGRPDRSRPPAAVNGRVEVDTSGLG
jgi:hypothetical protein